MPASPPFPPDLIFYQSRMKRASIAPHHSAHLLEQKQTVAENVQKNHVNGYMYKYGIESDS